MELSSLIARIASVIYLSVGFGMIFSADHYRRIADDISRNAALTYISGIIAVIVGFLILNYHNIWQANWTVLITLMGCLSLVKGVLIISFPGFILGLSARILKGRGFKVYPYAAILIGLMFGYWGFVSGGV